MPVRYVEYKGKKILYVDHSNQTGAQGIANLDEQAKEMSKWTQKGLVLNNYHNSRASPEFMAHAKKLGKEVFEPKTHKSAAIGLSGIQTILFDAYNAVRKNKLVHFRTEEEALEWLVKD